jgi:uncharacterized protein (DUF302 family)
VIADRGFTVFNVIDHSGVAGRPGVQMPDSTLVMFGKPAAGACGSVTRASRILIGLVTR